MEEIPHFFAFLIQFHFVLATAALKGTELSHSWCFLYPRSCVQVLCRAYCQGMLKFGSSLGFLSPHSLSGYPSFLAPWTHWEPGMATFPGVMFHLGLPLNWTCTPDTLNSPLSAFPSWVNPFLVLVKPFSTSEVLSSNLVFLIQIASDGLQTQCHYH